MKFWIWGCGIAVAIYAVFRHLFTDSINFSVWACIAGLIVAVVAEKYIPPIRRSLRNRERKLMLSVACPAFVVAVDISISDTPLYANVAVALLTFVIAFYAVRGVKNIDDERGLMKLITGCFTVCVLSGMFALLIYEGASRSDQTLLWIAVGAMEVVLTDNETRRRLVLSRNLPVVD